MAADYDQLPHEDETKGKEATRKDVEDAEGEIKKHDGAQSCHWHSARIFFGCGVGTGASAIALNQMSVNITSFSFIFGLVWTFVSLIAFGFVWNYAVMKAMAESAEEILHQYESMKETVTSVKKNNEDLESANKNLHKNSDGLREQEDKLKVASNLLKGDVKKLQNLQHVESQMLQDGLDTLKQRQRLREQQDKIRFEEELAELEFHRDESVNLARAFFQDAGEEDKIVDRKEFRSLQGTLVKRVAAFQGKEIKFEDFTDSKGASTIDRAEFMIHARPMINDKFEEDVKVLKQKMQSESDRVTTRFQSQMAELEKKIPRH